MGVVLALPRAPVAVSLSKRSRSIDRMALPSASYCVSVWLRTLSPVTLPAALQLVPLLPSVVKVFTALPAPSYWFFVTSPPGCDVSMTSPR